MRKSIYYCLNKDCEGHISLEEELKEKGENIILSGCRIYSHKGYSVCRDRKRYISPEQKISIMKQVLNEVGEKPFNNLLEKKAVLFQWRMTTPSNFWIAPLNDPENYEYHSYERNRPNMLAFNKIKDSDERITTSLFGMENGLPQESFYELKQDFIETFLNNSNHENT